MKILNSASKIVFLAITIGVLGGFFGGLLSEANFMLLAGAVFTYYFTNKGDTTAPYGGK